MFGKVGDGQRDRMDQEPDHAAHEDRYCVKIKRQVLSLSEEDPWTDCAQVRARIRDQRFFTKTKRMASGNERD